MSAAPFAEQATFPECVIPACRGIADRVGAPCADCVEAFGDYLTYDPRGRQITPQQITERDAGTLAAYRAMLAPAPVEPERKAMQVCWLCDGRHTCTRMPDGWECDTCREVTG